MVKKIKTAKGTYVEDITGQRFGRLVALELTDKQNNDQRWLWKCICDCGNIICVPMKRLKNGTTQSCGCLKHERIVESNIDRTIDLTGKRFGKLVVLERNFETQKQKAKDGHRDIPYWKCQCDCGTIVSIEGCELRRKTRKNGRTGTISCGCVSSRGEAKIGSLLSKMDIPYEKEKTFPGCRNPKTGGILRFDFYIPEQNMIIEYDGNIHSSPTFGWNDYNYYETIVYRDKIKTQFCEDNQIKLIRIPYTDYEDIDEEYLRSKIYG